MSDIEGSAEQLRRVLDDHGVRRAVTDYATFVDAREWDRLGAVFTPGVEVDYHNGRTQLSGAQAVVDYIRENTQHLAWQHHMVSVYGVDITGDEAATHAYLVSHQMVADEPDHVLMMAATYDLSLARGEERWHIAGMVHTIKVATYLPVTAAPPGGAFVPPAVRH